MSKGTLHSEVLLAGGALTLVTLGTILAVWLAMGGPPDPASVTPERLTVRTVAGLAPKVETPKAPKIAKIRKASTIPSTTTADPPPMTAALDPPPAAADGESTLRGTVETVSGSPIAGADVRVLKGRRTLAKGLSGADGAFALGPIDGGRFRVEVSHPQYAKEEFSRTGLPKEPMKVILKEGGGISGVVLDDWNSEPLARASVRVGLGSEAAKKGRRTLDEGTRTDEQGKFQIDGLPAGSYHIAASHRGYAVRSKKEVTVGAGQNATGLELRLKKEGVIEGKVVDDANGEPVAKALLVFRPPFPAGARRARTRRDGTFILKGVNPGRSTVEVSRSGFLTKQVSGVEITAGETKNDLEIRLQKPGAALDPDAVRSGDSPHPTKWARTRRAFQYAGIGAAVRGAKDGGVVVDKIFPGGAAASAGLTAGTTILEVDGKPVDGKDLRRAVEMLRGAEGESVTMRVRHPDGTEQTVQPIRKAHTVGAKPPKG